MNSKKGVLLYALTIEEDDDTFYHYASLVNFCESAGSVW